ncbi:monovalent cation/H+ antiporter subunit E [Corynebacterium renale]|uniref:monovalent cation/H+ antiporter subunit E n=1 Tax=Corynebacterium renale TaxID=1724 RepID=UPI000DA35E64|nr:monovalent cation/H+ antiporter subunit E [Corynebacterium renale]SQG63836.1 monovalent cation/H+ antiporter subunit E [Corynebacterium renale]STD02366.1 monovalent cation/H+ antiporter subunit E [Corynebacterium renale]
MHVIGYALWLIKEIFVAGFGLAFTAVFRPGNIDPCVVRYPLRVTSDWQLYWFSSSITVTPGTLSLGFREPTEPGGPRYLLVQAVEGSDPAAVVESLADMEARLAPSVRDVPVGAWSVDKQYEDLKGARK